MAVVKHPYPGAPLRRGSEGPAVADLQRELNTYGNHLDVDAAYGPSTERVVRTFQRNRHLGADGIVDAVIWARVFRQPAPQLHPHRPETSADTLRRLREEEETDRALLPSLRGQARSKMIARLAAVGRGITNRIRPAGPPAIVLAAYAAAARIDAQDLPYAWGGGHTSAGTPSRSIRPGEVQVGYDCSGSCGASFAAAGMGLKPGDDVPGSGWMAEHWGVAGEGRWMTVWANDEHVWIQWHLPGKAWRFDTSPQGSGGLGPHLRSGARFTTGFTPRHWPGC